MQKQKKTSTESGSKQRKKLSTKRSDSPKKNIKGKEKETSIASNSISKLDDTLLVKILSFVPIPKLFQSMRVCKRFFVCCPSAVLYRMRQEEDFIAEFPSDSQTYENCKEFTKQMVMLQSAWNKVSPCFRTEGKMGEKAKLNNSPANEILSWMTKSRRYDEDEVKVPLQYRLFLKETGGQGFNWNGREDVCEIMDASKIVKWNAGGSNDFSNSLWLCVALESGRIPITLCCDPVNDMFGQVCKGTSSDNGEVAMSWAEWLRHAHNKASKFNDERAVFYDTDDAKFKKHKKLRKR